MLTPTTPYNRLLDNGLVLKSIADESDVERLAAFNGQIFDQAVAEMTRTFIIHHPHTRPEHWLFVEDSATGQIVSSLALIPWQWRCEDVILKAGEVGIVGTLEAYRHRGLVRTLIGRHKELLREGEFDLSHIQGIGYFYRQFDYEYAIPLEAHWCVELYNLPDAPGEAIARYRCRRATLADLPVVARMYDEAARDLNISTVRDADTWRFLFEHTAGSATEGETWLIMDEADWPVGYWRISLRGFGKGLIVSESSRLRHVDAEALLHRLRAMAIERNKPYIRLNLPEKSNLVQTALGWGAHNTSTYAWQIHLPDIAHLLRKLAPVFDRRIAASCFSGLNQDVRINLYREAFELHFVEGRLQAVNAIGFVEGGEICIPPLLLAPLIFGYRSPEELTHTYPDARFSGQSRHLVEVLFPKLESFIYTNY